MLAAPLCGPGTAFARADDPPSAPAQPPPAPTAPAQTPPATTAKGPIRLREDVVVQAVRAEERIPVTKTDIDGEVIQEVNRGQEMPFLLGSTPSVNFQSDSGLAAGYTYFTIRGITQTRLNITLDGVPLQDPEDQALYFSAFGDFASVVGLGPGPAGRGDLERRRRLVRRLGQLNDSTFVPRSVGRGWRLRSGEARSGPAAGG
jgi:outer membrane receptor protein involved in Fe transport